MSRRNYYMKIIYQSDDGKCFETEEECCKYEQELIKKRKKRDISLLLNSNDFILENQNLKSYKLDLMKNAEDATIYILVHASDKWSKIASFIATSLFGSKYYFEDDKSDSQNLALAWDIQKYSGKHVLDEHSDSEIIIFEADDVTKIFHKRELHLSDSWYSLIYKDSCFELYIFEELIQHRISITNTLINLIVFFFLFLFLNPIGNLLSIISMLIFFSYCIFL